MYHCKISLRAKHGHIVRVKNTRGGKMELAIVTGIQVGLDKSLNSRVQYDVVLLRTIITRKHPWGRELYITVNEDNLRDTTGEVLEITVEQKLLIDKYAQKFQ